MNKAIEHNQQSETDTTSRRVQFSRNIAVCRDISQAMVDIGSPGSSSSGKNSSSKIGSKSPAPCSSSTSCWYTSKELKAFRRDIYYSIGADKAARKQKQFTTTGNTSPSPATTTAPTTTNETTTCMRGLEIFSSDVRRDLQKHYAKSVIEAQRRIKALSNSKKRKRSDDDDGDGNLEEDSILLQQVASRYSKYARDRAYEIAVKDESIARESQE